MREGGLTHLSNEEDMTYFQTNFDRSAVRRMRLAVAQEAVPKGDYLISVNSQSEMASIVVECQNCSEWSFRDVGNELTRFWSCVDELLVSLDMHSTDVPSHTLLFLSPRMGVPPPT